LRSRCSVQVDRLADESGDRTTVHFHGQVTRFDAGDVEKITERNVR
jgi:hypothetical protein